MVGGEGGGGGREGRVEAAGRGQGGNIFGGVAGFAPEGRGRAKGGSDPERTRMTSGTQTGSRT